MVILAHQVGLQHAAFLLYSLSLFSELLMTIDDLPGEMELVLDVFILSCFNGQSLYFMIECCELLFVYNGHV